MRHETAARLAAIGPHTDISLDPGECVVRWDGLQALVTDWARFALEFRVEAAGTAPEPDDRMFALWAAYRGRHPEVAARVRREVETWARTAGAAGGPAAQVQDPVVTVGRVGGEYQVRVAVGLESDEHGPIFRWEPATQELVCLG